MIYQTYRSIFSENLTPLRLRLLLMFLVSLVTASCSMRRFALKHHEFFSTQLAAQYLDLSHEQKDQFRQQWRVFSSRVAGSKIQPITKSLENLAETNDPTKITAILQQDITDVLRGACIDFSPVAVSLSATQLRGLRESLENRNKKYDPDQNGGLAKYRRHKQKEFRESMDQWLGGPNKAQQQLIQEIDREKDSEGRWEKNYLAYSREAQQTFLVLMERNRGDAPSFEKACVSFISNPDSMLSESSRLAKLDLALSRQNSLKAIFQTIDPSQREHLKRETTKLADELRSWARDVQEGDR